MKLSKVRAATNDEPQEAPSKIQVENGTSEGAGKEQDAAEMNTDKDNPVQTEKQQENSDSKETKPTKKNLLVQFQVLEWHAITLAGAEMEDAAKKERLTVMLAQLAEMGEKLKQESLKGFGISPKTVDLRIALTHDLVKQIINSDQRFPMVTEAVVEKQAAQAAINGYEASEWQLLEQGLKAKNAKTSNPEKREHEQEKLFKSADQYFGAACGLAAKSQDLGIPKEIVKMRTEQRLNHMGNDQDLRDMRNPSPEAYRLTGSAVFITYVKELIEKLAKAIKDLINAKSERVEPQPATPPLSESTQRPN